MAQNGIHPLHITSTEEREIHSTVSDDCRMSESSNVSTLGHESHRKATSQKQSATATALSDFTVNSIIGTELSNPIENAKQISESLKETVDYLSPEDLSCGGVVEDTNLQHAETEHPCNLPDISTHEQAHLLVKNPPSKNYSSTPIHNDADSKNSGIDINSTASKVSDGVDEAVRNTTTTTTCDTTVSPTSGNVVSSVWPLNNLATAYATNPSLDHGSNTVLSSNNLVDALLLHSPEKSLEQAVHAALHSLERDMESSQEGSSELSTQGKIYNQEDKEVKSRKNR